MTTCHKSAFSATIVSSRGARRLALLLLVLFVATVPCGGCKRPAPAAPEKTPPAPVKWEAPRYVSMEEWTELIGTTQPLPNHAARVTSPVTGRVVKVLPRREVKSEVKPGAVGDVKSAGTPGEGAKEGEPKPIGEGELVDEGDVLVQLDDSTVVANLAKAEAAKNVVEADRAVAVVAVKQAEVDLNALKDLEANQKKGGTILVSPVMMQKAELAVVSAKASLQALESRREAADKDVASYRIEQRLYTLTAPRKGRLGRLQVVLGQTLSAGSPVAEIVAIDEQIDVVCFVSASDVQKLHVGQPAHIGGIDDAARKTGPDPEGSVVYIADQAEAETGAFVVKVRFPNGELKLRANAVTRVRILTQPGKAAWVVPESALMEDQEPPNIVIVEKVEVVKNPDGKDEQIGVARRLRAVIGVRDRVLKQVEIVRLEDSEKKWSGDLEKTLIVIAKAQGLQSGDPVKLEEEDEDEAPKAEEK